MRIHLSICTQGVFPPIDFLGRRYLVESCFHSSKVVAMVYQSDCAETVNCVELSKSGNDMSRREAELSAKVAELRVALEDLESLKIRYFNFCHQSEQQEAQWSRMLAEKDIAMKEMYHRIKNNLQLISSLMRMQAELVTERHASAALTDCQQRIRSMALIHEHLYGNGCNDEINFGQFTRSLVGELSSSYAVGTQIRCAVNTNPVTLHAEKAIPCGLIVNELVSNAFKYAYPSGQGGEIRVNLAEDPAGRITLSISDHGVGLPAGFDWSNSHSMGLPLVEPLARQIGATLTVNQQGGTSVSIAFDGSDRALAASS